MVNNGIILSLANTLLLHSKFATFSDELLEASRLLTLTKYHCDVMSNCLGGDDEQDMMSSQIDKADAEALFTRKYHTEKDLIISTHKVAQQTCGLMQYHLTPPSDACSET